jgi:hypothetical protein
VVKTLAQRAISLSNRLHIFLCNVAKEVGAVIQALVKRMSAFSKAVVTGRLRRNLKLSPFAYKRAVLVCGPCPFIQHSGQPIGPDIC